MNIDDYQKWTKETASYPEAETGSVLELMYLALGLSGEAAEVANKVKKLYRDGDSEDLRVETCKELGDIMWYMGRLAEALGVELSDILDQNRDKLMNRKARGALSGSGDNR
jgi:NTP pyrophosphatase (non-canonical NTP hydrolase)